MQRILITGATGNVGRAVLDAFAPAAHQEVLTAVRAGGAPGTRLLDMEKPETFRSGLAGIHTLFLLRPPHISDVKKFFGPLVEAAKAEDVQHIVFLSVQGAESVSFIPHAKIEKLLRESGIPWTFIRPSYFMQNLATTLRDDIRLHNRIFLPSGSAPFLWVDVADIGRAIAAVLRDVAAHKNSAYTITGRDLMSFGAVAQLLTRALAKPIRYESPGLLRFYRQKRRDRMERGFILVMIMLHVLPRLQKPPRVSDDYTRLTGLEPVRLQEFLRDLEVVRLLGG